MSPDHSARRIAMPVMIVSLQAIAAVYFVVDSIIDLSHEDRHHVNGEYIMEFLVALALLAGVVMGWRYIRRLNRERQWQDQVLAGARGALADHIALRFQQWKLTPGEGEVALFALKGCDISEIARLRGAATGTVRSQLSQIYAKADVSSQAMFVSLFIEDLLDSPPTATSTLIP